MITRCLYLFLSISLAIGVLSSCVSHKAQYQGDWSRYVITDKPYYIVYLIGDAGYSTEEAESKVFTHLKGQLDGEGDNSAIVWLGDNIYPVGLAPSASPYHKEGRDRLMAQLETMSDYQGRKYFVPGNHDWYTYGRVGLRRQALLVDSFLVKTPNPNDQSTFFLPTKGCGDPSVVDLTEDIALMLMDSHWFLNEKARSGDLSVCAVKSAEEFTEKIRYEVNKNRDKSLIVTSHHPPYTYAHHGGRFPLKDDIFPLTQAADWLYLPIPSLGVLFNRARIRLSEQDVYHPQYRKYRSTLIEALEAKGTSIVASGHEHTLQFIEKNNQYFIVSGAGSKQNKVRLGSGSKFSVGEKGYVRLVFQNSKKAIAQFIVPGQFEGNNNIAYEAELLLK